MKTISEDYTGKTLEEFLKHYNLKIKMSSFYDSKNGYWNKNKYHNMYKAEIVHNGKTVKCTETVECAGGRLIGLHRVYHQYCKYILEKLVRDLQYEIIVFEDGDVKKRITVWNKLNIDNFDYDNKDIIYYTTNRIHFIEIIDYEEE